MSSFIVNNNTNGKSNTLANTLEPGTVALSEYKQDGTSLTFVSIVNPTIESCTTGYLKSGTDIGKVYCTAIISDVLGNLGSQPAGTKSETIPVTNYSSCSIIMCGAGGGGGGAGGTRAPGPVKVPLRPGGGGGGGGEGAL